MHIYVCIYTYMYISCYTRSNHRWSVPHHSTRLSAWQNCTTARGVVLAALQRRWRHLRCSSKVIFQIRQTGRTYGENRNTVKSVGNVSSADLTMLPVLCFFFSRVVLVRVPSDMLQTLGNPCCREQTVLVDHFCCAWRPYTWHQGFAAAGTSAITTCLPSQIQLSKRNEGNQYVQCHRYHKW